MYQLVYDRASMVLLLMAVPFVAGATFTVTSQLGTVPSDPVRASAETGSDDPLPRLGAPAMLCCHGYPPKPLCEKHHIEISMQEWISLENAVHDAHDALTHAMLP
jgi:hypothetical protein